MATTIKDTYTGDGSTVLYSFTFPYISIQDIKVTVDGTLQSLITEYTLANATTIEFITPPANGAEIIVYRETDITDLSVVFYPGSAIRAKDLNDNFTQTLYVTQEASNQANLAVTATAAQDSLLAQIKAHLESQGFTFN